ncbi:hypothetical protein HYDPIDRAFT_158779 [Hydnomerulius pinastri MD-312]|uniref:Uncharacterized protein n=1 Tax=Hydnomerulius pinastri MD-312 TaxID=994086 RepID=A0A0C9W5A5_9AGAM|nr:hypothetical protein HYDPIDRAFT_158779 [Hydnomerulius pinastri MD-312]
MASPRLASSSRLPPIQRGDSPRPRANGSLISEVFRPKLPLDPFAQLHTIREPWMLRLENVVAATSELRRDVVLVLGAPALRDISPVLQSPQLACSLLIIASHQPPPIPANVRAAICIIRLNAPLAVETNGAVRLVTLLECAERVARLWRKNGGSGLREIRENETGLDASMISSNLFKVPDAGSVSPSPLSSSEGLKSSISSRRSSFMSTSRTSLAGSRSRKSSTTQLPSADPFQRPFDVVLNYLSSSLNDKALLKQSILVTTISRPYLVAACPASSNQFTPKPSPESRRRSILRRSTLYTSPSSPTLGSRDSLQTGSGHTSSPTSAPLAKAHLLHILPQAGKAFIAQEKLIHNMESFQLSFSQPPSLSLKHPDALERAAAYIIPASALREVVRYSPPHAPSTSRIERHAIVAEWTVTDIVLSGALDPLTNPGEVPHTGPRAWISSAVDFAFTPEFDSGTGSTTSLAPPTPSSPASSLNIRERRRDSGISWSPMQIYDDGSSFNSSHGSTQPPAVPEKVKHRPVPRAVTDIPSPPSSSEESGLGSDYGRGTTVIATVDEKGVVGKRLRWRFWSSRGRAVTQ